MSNNKKRVIPEDHINYILGKISKFPHGEVNGIYNILTNSKLQEEFNDIDLLKSSIEELKKDNDILKKDIEKRKEKTVDFKEGIGVFLENKEQAELIIKECKEKFEIDVDVSYILEKNKRLVLLNKEFISNIKEINAVSIRLQDVIDSKDGEIETLKSEYAELESKHNETLDENKKLKEMKVAVLENTHNNEIGKNSQFITHTKDTSVEYVDLGQKLLDLKEENNKLKQDLFLLNQTLEKYYNEKEQLILRNNELFNVNENLKERVDKLKKKLTITSNSLVAEKIKFK